MSQLNNMIEKLTDRMLELVEKILTRTIEKVEEKLQDKFQEKILKSLEKKYEGKLEKETLIDDIEVEKDISNNKKYLNSNTTLYYNDKDLKSNTFTVSFDEESSLKCKKQKMVFEKTDNYGISTYNYNVSYSDYKDMSSNNFLCFDKNKKLNYVNYEDEKLIETHWDISLNLNNYNKFPPIVKKNDFQIEWLRSYFIIDNSKRHTYVELPFANITYKISSYHSEFCKEKEIVIKNITDNPILSKHNNIKQLNSDEISNVIMPECNKDKYVRLVVNEDNVWQVTDVF